MTTHKIGWLNMPGYKPETWNPVIGCSEKSEGCKNCFAKRMAHRLMHMPHTSYYQFVLANNGNEDPEEFRNIPEWNGTTHFVKQAIHKPIEWKSPRMIFTVDMGDLFHETVKYEWIVSIMNVIEMSPEHIFIILTKRPEIAVEFFKKYESRNLKAIIVNGKKITWPFSNLWIGVSAENQEQANERIPILLQIPAARRFVSIEPMLGPIFLNLGDMEEGFHNVLSGSVFCPGMNEPTDGPKLDWVICGGETGPKARPMHPDWVYSLRNQCKHAEVPFFFKQWGEWLPTQYGGDGSSEFNWCEKKLPFQWMCKVGHKKAGNMLGGQQYHEWPKNSQL